MGSSRGVAAVIRGLVLDGLVHHVLIVLLHHVLLVGGVIVGGTGGGCTAVALTGIFRLRRFVVRLIVVVPGGTVEVIVITAGV